MKHLFFIALAACSSCGAIAQGMSAADTRFLEQALHTGLHQLRLAELCVTHAADPAVKRFGEQMTVAHTKANLALRELAVKKNLPLPAAADSSTLRIYQALSVKKGSSFDHAYATQMVKEHERAVALFKQENLDGSDPEVRNHAAALLPVLEHHLLLARELETGLK